MSDPRIERIKSLGDCKSMEDFEWYMLAYYDVPAEHLTLEWLREHSIPCTSIEEMMA